MAATLQRPPTISVRQAHMNTRRTNPWLETVLSSEPIEPLRPKESPRSAESPDDIRPQSSTAKAKPKTKTKAKPKPKPEPDKKPAQSSLDEAFQAAIKAIVPERLEATRRAKAQTDLSQGTVAKDTPNITEFTQITSSNPSPTIQKLPKQKEKPLLQAAIEHLTLDRLHTVLYKALNESPKARSVFEREILAPPSPCHSDDEEAIAANKKMGRKRPRFEMCRWCKGEFDVTDNKENACSRHTGALDFKKRLRHDRADEKLENDVEGLVWDCCLADGDDDGCKTTAHEIDEDQQHPKKHKLLI